MNVLKSIHISRGKHLQNTKSNKFYTFYPKIFHINHFNIVYISTFVIVTVHMHGYVACVYHHHFINFTFCAFFFFFFSSLSFVQNKLTSLLTNTPTHKHKHTDKSTLRQIGAGGGDRWLWVDGVRAFGF